MAKKSTEAVGYGKLDDIADEIHSRNAIERGAFVPTNNTRFRKTLNIRRQGLLVGVKAVSPMVVN